MKGFLLILLLSGCASPPVGIYKQNSAVVTCDLPLVTTVSRKVRWKYQTAVSLDCQLVETTGR